MKKHIGLIVTLWTLLGHGVKAFAADSVVVFNEIQYHPADESIQTEWIEFRNLMGVDVDLSRWSISDGVELIFPEGTIISGHGILVVAANPNAKEIAGSSVLSTPFVGRLNNNGETLTLRNNNDRIMDRVSYKDSGDWPIGPDGSGATLTKINEASANSDPLNWVSSSNIGGTPGAVNVSDPSLAPKVTEVISEKTIWKFDDRNLPPPSNWSYNSFDDTHWKEGEGFFFNADGISPVRQEGLLGYWKLDEISGAVAHNSVANGADGRLSNNPIWLNDGERGRVLQFDGIDDFLVAGSATIPRMTTSNDFTWSFWAYSNEGRSNNVILGNRYSPTGVDYSPREFIKFTTSAFEFHRNGRGEDIDYSSIPLRRWIHHAVVKKGTQLTYYRQGRLSDTRSITQGLRNAQPFYFGGDRTVENWSGRLDDVAIWEKALPPSSISGLADGSLTPDSAPVSDSGVVPGTQMEPNTATYYFRKKFNYLGNQQQTALVLRTLATDGIVVYLNGKEIHRENLPKGDLIHTSLALSHVDRSTFNTPILLPGSALDSGENIISVEFHLHEVQGANARFGLTLNLNETPPDPLKTNPAMVFNEIAASTDPNFQIEITNLSAADSSDLSSFQILSSSGLHYRFPLDTVLNPSEFFVLDAVALGAVPGDGDRLFLVNPGGDELLDARRVSKRLRGRCSELSGRWLYPSDTTFGRPNSFSLNQDVVINEIMYHPRPLSATPDTPATFETTTLLDWNANWRFNESGANPGIGWEKSSHSIGVTWDKNAGPFGWESSAPPIPIRTELTRPANNNPYVITYYFETEFEITDEFLPNISGMQLVHMIDDGAVFYLNGVKIHDFGMPGGVVTFSTLADRGGECGISSPVPLSLDALRIGTNRISVEVHQTSTSSSDVVFGMQLFAVKELTPFIPGQPFRDSNEQWIELFNKGDSTVDMSDWRFDNGIEFEFPPDSVLGPKQFLVITGNVEEFGNRFPGISIFGEWSGSLSPNGEQIRLIDANGNPVDELKYHDGGRWTPRADGGGPSLELRDPQADNSAPEAWAPSLVDGPWQFFSYQGLPVNRQNQPTQYNEFIFGLLDEGECLIDDISVIEDPDGARRELIQNGTFSSGTVRYWRMLGTHSHFKVVDDPENPKNKALHLKATGSTQHMSNHAETTLKSGGKYVSINSNLEYRISFRVKWLGGSNQLNTRLYFNRLALTSILAAPRNNGTPGSANSVLEPNIGATFDRLSHEPVVPEAGENITVSVLAQDPDGIQSLKIHYSVNDGMFQIIPMSTLQKDFWAATIPGQALRSKVQFYIEACDSLGQISLFPAKGPDSRAIIPFEDGQANLDYGDCRPNNFRIVMNQNDIDLLHLSTNVMSNDRLGCTVIFNEKEIYYDCGIRLKGSEHGRAKNVRVGYNIRFSSDQPFLGAHETVAVDRSGAGDQFSQKEIMIKHAINHSGAIPGMYDDLIRVIAPRSEHTGSAQLLKSRFDNEFLKNQFKNGSNGMMFEYELIYPLSGTVGGVEGLKITQDGGVRGTGVRNLGGRDKELYRWYWLIKNNQDADDYSRLIEVLSVMGLSGSAYREATDRLLDVDQWLRCFAIQVLFGIGDNYSSGAQHNAILYIRPVDQKTMFFPWDMDFTFSRGATSNFTPNGDLDKLIAANPANKRAYYGHLLGIIETTFNEHYMGPWAEHYSCFLPNEDLTRFISYIRTRRTAALNAINAAVPKVPFRITTSDGANVTQNLARIRGDGWIDIQELRLAGSGSLEIEWINDNYWQIDVPIKPGRNLITIQAYDRNGHLMDSDTVEINGTAETILANSSNLSISEMMYHPAEPTSNERASGILDADDFEFIELVNLSQTHAVDLAGTEFTNGIIFEMPSTILDPGQFALIVGNQNAFETRYGDHFNILGEFQRKNTNKLSNQGESLTLVDAINNPIFSFSWSDELPWPISADGNGYSMVLMLPGINDPQQPQNWRTSFSLSGNPLESDQIPLTEWMNLHDIIDLAGDFDRDGRNEIFEFATGSDPTEIELFSPILISFDQGQKDNLFFTLTLILQIGADEIDIELQSSTDLKNWISAESVQYLGRINNGNGTTSAQFRSTSPVSTSASQFIQFIISEKRL